MQQATPRSQYDDICDNSAPPIEPNIRRRSRSRATVVRWCNLLLRAQTGVIDGLARERVERSPGARPAVFRWTSLDSGRCLFRRMRTVKPHGLAHLIERLSNIAHAHGVAAGTPIAQQLEMKRAGRRSLVHKIGGQSPMHPQYPANVREIGIVPDQ